MKPLVQEISIKLLCQYLVQNMLHQIKAQQFYTDLGVSSTVRSQTEKSTNQGIFKAFEPFSSTLQGRFNLTTFQESPLNSSTFQACVNPACML